MKQELKSKWVEALRSGNYKQLSPGGSYWRRDGEHCCLGVLGELVGAQRDMDDRVFRGQLPGLGLPIVNVDALIDMNDRKGSTFAEIADYIEANVPADTVKAHD